MENSDYSATPYIVNLDVVGPLTVYVQGDLEKLKDGVVFLTVHGAGSSFNSWLDFAGDESMQDIRKRALFLHVSLPGQVNGAEDLPRDFIFPSMEAIGLNLITVMDHLRIKQVVGLGDGAGANIILRFAMNHPSRVHGVLAINTEGVISSGYKEMFMDILSPRTVRPEEELNTKNVSKYCEAYKKRSEILSKLKRRMKVDVLLLAGVSSTSVGDTEAMHKEITPGLCSIIKLEEVDDPLVEAPEKVAEALILFCQGQGLMPTINRQMSRQESTCSQGSDGMGRKLSMTDYDTPNIMRLSLSSGEMEHNLLK
eukprot:TRINITY_DN4388_c0_g1_i3.p1 TRINITY_DN4388_c0_g1~~TRINITY_DN4388_c0_g1_i3.p1  ORF type:complete len:311 (-),score=97.47 TRINITY_DN4388_c0_g1_i3:236-1168(-)